MALLLAMVQCSIYLPANAGTASPAAAAPAHAESGAVRIGTQTVITVPVASGTTSIAERVKQIQKNVDNSLVAASDRSPSTIKITYVKGTPVITLGGFLVTAVDSTTAKAAHVTPAVLAQRWVDGLRAALSNKANVNHYMANLTGAPEPMAQKSNPKQVAQAARHDSHENAIRNSSAPNTNLTRNDDTSSGAYGVTPYARARVVFVPAGMVMPMKLSTALSSQISKPGDLVMATLADPVNLGDATIPANTVITGHVTKSTTGTYLSKSGRLGVKFTSMRTPDGVDTPITAHITGSVGKYQQVHEGDDVLRGETGETKLKKALVGAAIGAGSGALFGTTIGAIAGGGRGAGRGILAGTAIGAGAGLLASYLQKGHDVSVSSEDSVKLQLDAPAKFALASFSNTSN